MPTIKISAATERDALCGFMDKQRDALVRKIEGVSEADARRTPTVSSLSLLNLIKHSAVWERRWFQIIFEGRTFPDEWPAVEEAEDSDFDLGDEDTVESLLAYYAEQSDISREISRTADFDTACAMPKLADRNFRWVLLHMIEETARHAGHADLIRETLDGSRGM